MNAVYNVINGEQGKRIRKVNNKLNNKKTAAGAEMVRVTRRSTRALVSSTRLATPYGAVIIRDASPGPWNTRFLFLYHFSGSFPVLMPQDTVPWCTAHSEIFDLIGKMKRTLPTHWLSHC